MKSATTRLYLEAEQPDPTLICLTTTSFTQKCIQIYISLLCPYIFIFSNASGFESLKKYLVFLTLQKCIYISGLQTTRFSQHQLFEKILSVFFKVCQLFQFKIRFVYSICWEFEITANSLKGNWKVQKILSFSHIAKVHFYFKFPK